MTLFKRLAIAIKARLFASEEIRLLAFDPATSIQSATTDIRPVTSANLTDVLNFQTALYVDVFRQFLALGDRGYYAYIDNKCVHRSWVKSNEQSIKLHWAYSIQLQPGQHFIHYCETAPQARGKGIYPAVLSQIVHDLKGPAEILISINPNNTASINGAKKAGFREIERIKVRVILGIKFIRKQYLSK